MMDSEDEVFSCDEFVELQVNEEDEEEILHKEDPMEETVQGVRQLLSRFHGADETDNSKKRERADSGSDVLESPKTPRKDEPTCSGKFIFRSARTEDPLHFIHRIRLSNDAADQETEDLVTIIRSTETQLTEDQHKDANLSLITAALVRQFEQATESDGKRPRDSEDGEEGPSQSGLGEDKSVPMATDQFSDSEDEAGEEEVVSMSLKEQLADQEEEKTKERASTSSLDGADLDFNILENSRPLNLDASKQRVVLRQKGSLAKRRRPTRSSLRVAAPDSSEISANETSADDLVNGHNEEEEKEEISMSYAQEEFSMAGPALRTGKSLGNRKAPVLLPGLGESIRAPKLRPTEKKPLSKPTESNDSPSSTSQPAWLAEARLRKSTRPPRGEVEKLIHETEPEKPSWMKEVAAKKKKVPTATLR